MIFDTVEGFRIWRYTDQKSDKVWGFFCHDRLWYAFWGGTTQAMSFKDHGNWSYDVAKLSQSKQKKGYAETDISKILEKNPEWKNEFNNRFTWFKLITSVPDIT